MLCAIKFAYRVNVIHNEYSLEEKWDKNEAPTKNIEPKVGRALEHDASRLSS
ncbi:hypothetical protein VCRA217O315_260062 [Vibrio crassostreae]|nr:hypothetical protein VCRA217O315_260062 [Vibrio crassostreae]